MVSEYLTDKSLLKFFSMENYIELGMVDLSDYSYSLYNKDPFSDNVFNSLSLYESDILKMLKEYKDRQAYSSSLIQVVISARDKAVYNGYEYLRCNCGSDNQCEDLSYLIDKYAKQFKLDPILVLSLIVQESGCDQSVVSPKKAYGLTQITEVAFEEHCMGMPNPNSLNSFNQVKEEGNEGNNIWCGIRILLDKYYEFRKGVSESWSYENLDDFKEIVDQCVKKHPLYGEYKSWKAGYRGYNGWGCEGSGADIYYADKVNSIHEMLKDKVGS